MILQKAHTLLKAGTMTVLRKIRNVLVRCGQKWGESLHTRDIKQDPVISQVTAQPPSDSYQSTVQILEMRLDVNRQLTESGPKSTRRN